MTIWEGGKEYEVVEQNFVMKMTDYLLFDKAAHKLGLKTFVSGHWSGRINFMLARAVHRRTPR